MSNITFLMLIVPFVQIFSVDGQSTLGSSDANGLNSAGEIFDEIRYLQDQVRVCNYNKANIEDLLGRHLKGMTQALQSFNNRLEALDQNVRSGIELSEGLQLLFQNLSKRYEKQENNLQSAGKLLQEQHQYSRNQSATSTCSHQGECRIGTWSRDCADIRKVGHTLSDVYKVSSLGLGSIPVEILVYCDIKPDTSWLVFQRRKDGSENFERTWIEYENGFGNCRGEFWLGNNALHVLTSNRNYKLRIELEDFEGNKRYAEYAQFAVGSASDYYRLVVSGYSGNAGDNMAYHNGQMFSTMDADHDNKTNQHCPQVYRGAWWHKDCHQANLNGLYLRGNHTSFANGVEWFSFRGHHYSLKVTEMKIAPRN